MWSGRFGDRSPEAPTDPDVRNYRIRLFSARLRYVTGAERIRGCGNGDRCTPSRIRSHTMLRK